MISVVLGSFLRDFEACWLIFYDDIDTEETGGVLCHKDLSKP